VQKYKSLGQLFVCVRTLIKNEDFFNLDDIKSKKKAGWCLGGVENHSWSFIERNLFFCSALILCLCQFTSKNLINLDGIILKKKHTPETL